MFAEMSLANLFHYGHIFPQNSMAVSMPPTRTHLSPLISSAPFSINQTLTQHQIQNLSQTKQLHAYMLKTQINPTPPLFNSIISSYIKHDSPLSSLLLYSQLRISQTQLDTFTIPSLLKACAQLNHLSIGKEIHGYLSKFNLGYDIYVYNSLMQMYAECGSMGSACKVFDEMGLRDVVSYSTMVRCYTKLGWLNEALDVVREMVELNIRPSEVGLVNMISVFADVGNLRIGWPVHAYLMRNVSQLSGINVKTSLIDMYVKCGSVERARLIFDLMAERTVASWSAMIGGYIRSKRLKQGLELFDRMRWDDVVPNEITMLSLIVECGIIRELVLGKWIHAQVIRNGFDMSLALGTAIVDMYCKCGDIRSARCVFDGMGNKDIMIWTAMIMGYSQANCFDEAFELFSQMKGSNVKPNEMTVVNLLSLCAEAGALDRGRWVHGFIDKRGIRVDVVLATALVDMYAKCGEVESAFKVFTETRDKDVCMWNAMLNGFAMNGFGDETIKLFSRMEIEREVKPNDVTFIGVLRACSHSGLVDKGKELFDLMSVEYGLSPKVEHYGCMVDLLGRAGLLEEAYKFVKTMHVPPNVIVWGSLLAACKVHKNSTLGEEVAKELLKLEPNNIGYNVLLSNIYALQRKWNEVSKLRTSMKEIGMKKTPGICSIEMNGQVHEFVNGDETHVESNVIYKMVDEMHMKLKLAGHVVDTSVVMLNVDEEEKENALNYHSEKLAMAYGLIKTGAGTTIRIVKNLRVCDDCHAATKLLSRIYGRDIVVRDRNRFHRFSQGQCSCRDYW